jgi:hypothetical protein
MNSNALLLHQAKITTSDFGEVPACSKPRRLPLTPIVAAILNVVKCCERRRVRP